MQFRILAAKTTCLQEDDAMTSLHGVTARTVLAGYVKRAFVLSFALILVLAGTSFAQTAGFNVDSQVDLTIIPSTYQVVRSTAGCPAGYAGKFTFSALLTNNATNPAMPGLAVHVATLTNGNVLLDPQTNEVLGGTGAVLPVPKVGQYADGLMSPGESVQVPFVLCMKSFQPFQFYVDVFGIVTRLVDRDAFDFDISADGRFVSFISAANDLVARDPNQLIGDVFLRDLQNGTTSLVSINRYGTNGGDGFSYNSLIGSGGRFVAFSSDANDLISIPEDRPRSCAQAVCARNDEDVFIRDMQNGITSLVSINRFGTGSGNARSQLQSLSADGQFVLFLSEASDLVENDTNGEFDVFVRDLQNGTTTLASVNRFGTYSGNGRSLTAKISSDGRFVIFKSGASDLVENRTNGSWHVFVRDMQKGITTLMGVGRNGMDSASIPTGNDDLYKISADGRFVAFETEANDLDSLDPFMSETRRGGGYHLYVRPVP
jgi:hypothetical protein